MKFITTLSISASVLIANASPVDQRSSGTRIALNKRDKFVSPGGDVDHTLLQKHVAYAVGKIQKGFRAYANNMGKSHPYEGAFLSTTNELPDVLTTTTIETSLPVSTTVISPIVTPAHVVKRAGSPVPLKNEGVALWHGEITVGNPAQKFTVDFDTGSSDLFLASPDCSSNCEGHERYNAGPSGQALSKTFQLGYGDGSSVSGNQYQDTVSIAGMTAVNQTLGSATDYSSGFAKGSFAPDGLLGMAFQSISNYQSAPLFQNLVEQGQAEQAMFAFKLTETDSELYVGGVNSALYKGDFTWVSVSQEGYWQVNFDAISNNSTQILTSMSAIIDTGTTLIIGDSDAVSKFYSQIPGAQPAFDTVGQGMYTFPCSSVPTISFTFGGKTFPISQDDFNMGTTGSDGQCVGSIVGNDNMSFWIVGDVFLRGVYTAFDFGGKRVGFAELA